MQIRLFFMLLLLWLPVTGLFAQSQVDEPAPSIDDEDMQTIRLDELARLLQNKIDQRAELEKTLSGVKDDIPAAKQALLKNLNRDIGSLSDTFEMIALGNTDTALLKGPDVVTTDWRQDLLDILNPLIESLTSITKRPRQVADARNADRGPVGRHRDVLFIRHHRCAERRAQAIAGGAFRHPPPRPP